MRKTDQRQRIADGLYRGIASYLDNLNSLAVNKQKLISDNHAGPTADSLQRTGFHREPQVILRHLRQMPMRSYYAFLIALIGLVVSPAFGQSNHKGGNQQVLPATFAGWNCISRISLDLGRPHATVAGNPTAMAAEYGFRSGEQCTYTRGNNTLEAQLYVMSDATAAYGEYSYLRTSDLPKADLGEHSSMAEHRALALDSNLVLDVFDAQDDLTKLESDLKALLSAISVHAEEGPLPTLWQHLPADNQVLRSDHYILGPMALAQFFPLEQGDWLGFSNGAEAEAAHYNLGGQDVNLLIADFPTPQMAARKAC